MATFIDPSTTADVSLSNGAWLERLHALGEHTVAGFLAQPDTHVGENAVLPRMAHAVRRQLEEAETAPWSGEALYPSGAFSWYSQGSAVTFHYSHSLVVNHERLYQCIAESTGEDRMAYRLLLAELGDWFQVGSPLDEDIRLGGANYTHSILNYGRVLSQGLDAHAARVERGLATAEARNDTPRAAFYRAMHEVLLGIRAAHERSLDALRQASGVHTDGRLLAALERVPWQPARTFYEGLVAVNWLYYLDGTDNLGRFDQVLGALYDQDLAASRITHDEAVALVGQMWANVDANSGWNVALGGSRTDGSSAENTLTRVCLEAARGRRRPNLALRVREDLSDEAWDAALDSIASGCGLPALYNEALYLQAIRDAHLNVRHDDLADFAFGGCTELMVHGCSNVGSLDAGLNLPLILAQTLERALTAAPSFDALVAAFIDDLEATVARLARQVSEAQELHARFQPQPIRTLLIDDCLDAAVEYNAGGARYNWSVVNVGGLGNVADALAAMRETVFERGEVAAQELLDALRADFQGYEALQRRLAACPRYGNDEPAVDALARDIAQAVFVALRRYAPWRGGRFIPGCLMFTTYARAGEPVPATPDGRRASEPIADSIGAVQGRDRHGPTALLRSTASLPQPLAPGTLVTNIRVAPTMFHGENRTTLRDLVRTYFRLGGLQLQITVVDQETLHDAVAHPERHGDLIVRVGGYSEYWRNLSDELRRSILQRTEHAL